VTEVAFYHLSRSPLEAALPKLLEKTLEAGKRALVLASSEERVEALNGILWTYDQDSWLPHGSAKDGDPEEQPVWLSVIDPGEGAAPNRADFLFLTDGADSRNVGAYERCFDIFDGNDETAVEAARERWKVLKEAGHDLAYWRQTETGGWEKQQ